MMMLLPKLTSRLYLESKRQMVYRSLPSGRIVWHGSWCLGTRRSTIFSASLKKPLTRNKFQHGLLNGDTMSPTTGNGRKQMPYFLETCIYKAPMNYPCYFSYHPQNFQQFTIELANKGITVLGIGQEPYEQLDEPLRNSLTEYFRVDNLENIDEVKRAVAFCSTSMTQSTASNLTMNTGLSWMQHREQFNVFWCQTRGLSKDQV